MKTHLSFGLRSPRKRNVRKGVFYRYVTISKWELKWFFKPKLKSKISQSNWAPEYPDELLDHMEKEDHNKDPFAQCPSCKEKVHINEIKPHYRDGFISQLIVFEIEIGFWQYFIKFEWIQI